MFCSAWLSGNSVHVRNGFFVLTTTVSASHLCWWYCDLRFVNHSFVLTIATATTYRNRKYTSNRVNDLSLLYGHFFALRLFVQISCLSYTCERLFERFKNVELEKKQVLHLDWNRLHSDVTTAGVWSSNRLVLNWASKTQLEKIPSWREDQITGRPNTWGTNCGEKVI